MYCTRKILDDLVWVGANDRRLALFEGVYSVPNGVSYNSYLLKDEKKVLFDTVDKAVFSLFFENLEHELAGEKLDYVIVQHMEPDHSATLKLLLTRYPDVTIVCNQKTKTMMEQFFEFQQDVKYHIVKEGDILNTGRHNLTFVMAPMVHWPEVMVTYDSTNKILFSADAFGSFGALNGAIFADEIEGEYDYFDEARRYYCNIVGKYGTQVQALLKKASNLDIDYVCPIHGYVWRSRFVDFIDKYVKWSTYTPEDNGVMIAYASVYGNTATAAEILATKLREKGIKTVVYDVSVTPVSQIVANAFKWSHLVFASTTYNAGIFISMEDVLRDLVSHNIQNRTVGFIENGSWATTSGNLMQEILSSCKNMTFLENKLSIKSSLKNSQIDEINALVNEIVLSLTPKKDDVQEIKIDSKPFFNIQYGLYLLSAKAGEKDNACIINTAQMLTDNPKKISISVNKQNYTHEMIINTKKLNISILAENADFDLFERFGFHSGKDTNKFENTENFERSENGLLYLTNCANAYISATVEKVIDCGSHSLFIAIVNEAKVINTLPSVTYEFYLNHIKPKTLLNDENKVGYVCKICGYFYEGKTIPQDFICPLCKHGASDFEFIG